MNWVKDSNDDGTVWMATSERTGRTHYIFAHGNIWRLGSSHDGWTGTLDELKAYLEEYDEHLAVSQMQAQGEW